MSFRVPFFGRAILALAMGFAFVVGSVRAENLDRALLKTAPDVLDYLDSKGYKNVGVLKFLVQKGEDKATDRAGQLNSAVARRLEMALILKNKEKEPINIIQDASAVAAAQKDANHRTEAGRKQLFEAAYKLAWGKDEEVKADAFLTGKVVLSADMKKATLNIEAFGKDSKEPELVITPAPTVDVDSAILLESGESFLLRGVADGGKVVDAVTEARDPKNTGTLVGKDAPILLDILYNDKPVKIETKDGQLFVREPKQDEKVSFQFRRLDKSKEVFGIVLKVNGENTLFQERKPDVACRKWIMEPEDQLMEKITSFRTADKKGKEFQVATVEESKEDAINYGPDFGMITMVVFKQKQTGKEAPKVDPDADTDEQALLRGVYPPATRPEKLEDLQIALRPGVVRGAVKPGTEVPLPELKRVPFQPEPTPVMAISIRYYKP